MRSPLTTGGDVMKKRNPVPRELCSRAVAMPSDPPVRSWGDEVPHWADAWFATPKEALHAQYPGLVGCEHNYLAISGGGASGAFGAGLLKGWTESGTRPEFAAVTGVSTGALAAPFAYLGPTWDHKLEQIYTSYSTKDLVSRTLLSAVTSSALYSTQRLQGMIARFFNRGVMAAVAAEYREKGRVLSIGTTNLDTLRPVIWNIGRIAASGHPGALGLIRKILLASASIPIAFPPVRVEVEVDGRPYDELHVDGGASAQIFLYPAGLDWARVLDLLDVKGRPNVYLIRNSSFTPDWKPMKPLLMPIAMRTMQSLIRTQGIGDTLRVYLAAQRDGLDFHLADIPETFDDQPKELFDPAYMRQLFDLGHRSAVSGYPWKTKPHEF